MLTTTLDGCDVYENTVGVMMVIPAVLIAGAGGFDFGFLKSILAEAPNALLVLFILPIVLWALALFFCASRPR